MDIFSIWWICFPTYEKLSGSFLGVLIGEVSLLEEDSSVNWRANMNFLTLIFKTCFDIEGEAFWLEPDTGEPAPLGGPREAFSRVILWNRALNFPFKSGLHLLFFQTLPHRYQTSIKRYLTCMLAYSLHMFYQIKSNRWRIPLIGFTFWPIRAKRTSFISLSETRKPNFVSAPSDKIGLNLVHGVCIIKTPTRLSVRRTSSLTPYDPVWP